MFSRGVKSTISQLNHLARDIINSPHRVDDAEFYAPGSHTNRPETSPVFLQALAATVPHHLDELR